MAPTIINPEMPTMLNVSTAIKRITFFTFVATVVFAVGSEVQASKIEAVVEVTGGIIEGEEMDRGLKVWQGIPFAAPPVGDLRWRAPHPVVPWDGVLKTTEPGASSVQAPGPPGGFYTRPLGKVSEDCLYLNVWTRADSTDDKLPVMYWIHGGGLTGGSGSSYSGDFLTSKGVVLVTVNYRLGALGFLAHEELSAEDPNGVSGNQGIADQIAGLEWVRDNISKFGGDPDNVTIFGESAGSLSVSMVHASPLAKGLFHRAIGESGGAFQPMTHRTEARPYSPSGEEVGAEFAGLLLGKSSDSTLADLRALPAEKIMAAQGAIPYDRMGIVDGRVIHKEIVQIFLDGEQSDVPLLTGSNGDEGTTFLPYFQPAFGSGIKGFKAYSAVTLPEAGDEVAKVYPASNDEEADLSFGHLFADVVFTYPQRVWAAGMGSVKSPAYLYHFTWDPPVPDTEKYGSFHAGEIGYIFGTLDLFGATPTKADENFSETMSDIWVQFAHTGNPNVNGLPEWPAFTKENQSYMELGQTIKPKSNLRMEEMMLIERAFRERRAGK
jgi:para-nitrobenzyl esterase